MHVRYASTSVSRHPMAFCMTASEQVPALFQRLHMLSLVLQVILAADQQSCDLQLAKDLPNNQPIG